MISNWAALDHHCDGLEYTAHYKTTVIVPLYQNRDPWPNQVRPRTRKIRQSTLSLWIVRKRKNAKKKQLILKK